MYPHNLKVPRTGEKSPLKTTKVSIKPNLYCPWKRNNIFKNKQKKFRNEFCVACKEDED